MLTREFFFFSKTSLRFLTTQFSTSVVLCIVLFGGVLLFYTLAYLTGSADIYSFLVVRCCWGQVAHPASLVRARSIMQYVALVECLKSVRTLAAKVGALSMGVAKNGGTAGKGEAGKRLTTSPRVVKALEELAHALGALEALLAEGAGDSSASGENRDNEFSAVCLPFLLVVVQASSGATFCRCFPLFSCETSLLVLAQASFCFLFLFFHRNLCKCPLTVLAGPGMQPGIGKGDRKRRLQGFEALLAKRDVEKDAADAANRSQGDIDGDGDGADASEAANDPGVAAAISAHRGREAARDKRPRGGIAPSLMCLLWDHQLPAALAAGVAAAARASEEAAEAAAMARRAEGTMEAGAMAGEGPASAAAALVLAAVRQV